MLANATRRLATSSRSLTMATALRTPVAVTTQSLHTSASLRKGPPTHSEESVKGDKHNHSIEELQRQTSSKAKSEFDQENQNPTMSEEASKADVHKHDPLPEHKKKRNSKPE